MEGRRDGWPVPADDDEIAWIRGILESSGRPSHALDPLCGSGQVLYEFGKKGWKCTGMEADPLLRWIASVRSYRFRPDAAEFAGYAWERVADDVFWESEVYTVPEVPGTISYGVVTTDFLRRVRRQIDRESDEGINSLLKAAFLSSLPEMAGDDSSFDDRKGMNIYSGRLADVKGNLDPNSEITQTVHLCDSRDIPYTLRNSYDMVVSVLPPIVKAPDAELRRTMSQWMGFSDIMRRDEMSVGCPLGDEEPFFEAHAVKGFSEDLPMETVDDKLVHKWFSDIVSVASMMKEVMSSRCTAFFLAPDETVGGRNIDKAGILAGAFSEMGLSADTEGSGSSKCVRFARQ
jgi:hypothetical protein